MNHQTLRLPQIAYNSPQPSTQSLIEFPQMDSGLAVPVFNLGDDPIAYLNKGMDFLTAVASLRFPSTNNQLRTSSNLRNQAIIQDGRVTVQQVQGRQGLHYAGNSYKAKEAKECCMVKEKEMLAEAHEAGQILDEEQLAFLADLGIPDGQAVQTTIPNTAAFQTKDLDAYALTVMMSLMQRRFSWLIFSAMVLMFSQRYLILKLLIMISANQEKNNESVTTELKRYKERVKTFEQRLNVDVSTREKMIDSQMDDMIKEKLSLKQQIDSLEQNLSNQIKKKESLLQTFTVFKNESREKENKYIDKEIDLEKKIKELDNIVYKVGQSAQTLHMLTKPQVFYDNAHKQAVDTVMSDSDESTVTYTEVSSPFEGLSDIGSPGVVGPEHAGLPSMLDDPAATASPTAQSPDYVLESDPEEDLEEDDDKDPKEDPVYYPGDRGDDSDDKDESLEDDEDDDVDIEADDDVDIEADDDEEEEEHPAPADSIVVALLAAVQAPSAEETEPFETDESAATPPPHPAYRVTAKISILAPVPILVWSDVEVSKLLAISTPPSSPLSPWSSPLPQIPSLPLPPILSPLPVSPPLPQIPLPPLPVSSPVPVLSPSSLASPIHPLGYRAAMIQLRAEATSTSQSLPLPPSIILSHTRPDAPSSRTPPFHLLSTDHREDRLEVTLPPRKRLGEVYTRLDDEHTGRQLLAGRVNMLFRDRRAHARTARLIETEARMSKEAWGRSTDGSDLARIEVMSLRTTVLAQKSEIRELQSADRRRQMVIIEMLMADRRRQKQFI
ncbi:hypothetical protein Tco_0700211 [Tanacetum coccineum]